MTGLRFACGVSRVPGVWNDVGSADLAIFLGIQAHSSRDDNASRNSSVPRGAFWNENVVAQYSSCWPKIRLSQIVIGIEQHLHHDHAIHGDIDGAYKAHLVIVGLPARQRAVLTRALCIGDECRY
jgi:hypothetical protein